MAFEKDMLRPVGDLERFSTARHNLGYYRCVANTARYRTDTEPQLLGSIIEAAIAQVVLKHGALCCGIIDEGRKDPSFVRLESINISNLIKYHLPKPSQTEDEAITEALECQHSQLFQNLDSQPGWRVIIIPTLKWPETKGAGFDIIFAFHHALADGVSGLVFHRSMLEALNNPMANPAFANHVLQVPQSLALALPVEKAISFRVGWIFFFKALWNAMGPKWLLPAPVLPWAGADCSEEPLAIYWTKVKLIQISPNTVTGILSACKKENTTLTGLLHGLTVLSLAKRIPSAPCFSSTTPYSLRHLSSISPTDDLGVHLSSLDISFSPEIISKVRSAPDPAQVMVQVWDIARYFRKAMATELHRLPSDNLIGMIPYVSDMHKMFTSMIGKPRSSTYEISNVGVLKCESNNGKWRIQRDIFSQSASLTGAAMSFNVASTTGGPLTISVTWLCGVVEDSLVDEVRGDIEYALNCVAEGKEISLDIFSARQLVSNSGTSREVNFQSL